MNIVGIKVRSLIVLCIAGALMFLPLNLGTYADAAASKREFWKSEGYDYILDIDGDDVTIYNYSKDSLLPFAYGRIEKDGMIYTHKVHGDTILNKLFTKPIPFGHFQNGVLTEETGYAKRFKRIEKLPNVSITAFTKDPIQSFEAFWQIFDENFSLFRIANADWKRMYEEYKVKITPQTSQKELLSVFKEMIQKLKDGHTKIIAGTSSALSKEDNERQKLYADNSEQMQKNIESCIQGQVKTKLDGRIQYGKMKDGIGYLALNDFDAFDAKEISQALDDVVKEFADNKGMIIDLRFNGGGSDAFALAAASRFASEKKLVFSKHARSGGYDEFFKPTPIYIEPAAKRISAKKIVVMTSQMTASAAEIAAMAFKEIGFVTVIGEKTSGIHSDVLMNILPNEWIVTLSAEQYIAADGKVYEQIGLKPDEEVPISKKDIQKGKDPVLARAVKLLKP